MFQQFKHIDSAFRFIRLFCILFLVGTVVICVFVINRTAVALQKGQQRIYVLSNGKLLEAAGIERADSMAVEVRDHVKMFHYHFYTLTPDDAANKRHVTAALYLADNIAKQEYNNLVESGYYNNIISANINQEVADYDSIQVDLNHTPYYFRYYGKLRIIRTTSILTRSLITDGYIRVMPGAVSDHNPHGMLIEGWKVVENKDLNLEKR
jgi:conjugative transposon TraK protein